MKIDFNTSAGGSQAINTDNENEMVQYISLIRFHYVHIRHEPINYRLIANKLHCNKMPFIAYCNCK